MTEPTGKQLEDFAVEEQFLLFCDVDEFTQIARAVLAKWGSQPVVREPLTDEQIRALWFAAAPTSDGRSASWNYARAIERAHGITPNGRKDGS